MKNLILSTFLLILIAGLAGCISDDISLEDDSFLILGKWNQINSDIIMEFQTNGILNLISDSNLKVVNYEIIEDKNIKIYLDNLTEYWEYEFLNNNTMQLRIKGNSQWEILERE